MIYLQLFYEFAKAGLFAIGGGKALDTVKALGLKLDKPVITFPTIASTCAACTAVSILYHPDGSFAGPCFLPGPPAHAFLDTAIISAAPPKYLWAGLGDTYAKYFESTMSARNDELAHYHALGVGVSRMCLDPLLRYGAKAMRDHREQKVTPEVEQVILTIIVNTARGGLIDTEAMISALESGKLSSAALDVVEDEFKLYYNDCRDLDLTQFYMGKLREMPNVMITHHIAFYYRNAVMGMIYNCLYSMKMLEEGKEIPLRLV